MSWERSAALAGLWFIALYFAAFALGIEVGASDREILDYYSDSANRAKELAAFFLIAAAGLSYLVYAVLLRSLIVREEAGTGVLAALTLASGATSTALVLAGNAVSRATAFAAMDEEFELEPNTRRLLENVGFLLFVCATLAAMVLVVSVSLAVLRCGILPRWLGWAGFPIALLLPLAIAFVGYLVLMVWVLTVSGALLLRPPEAKRPSPG